MEFTVTKSDLKAALDYVSISLSGNAKEPAATHVLVTIDKDLNAKMAATDHYSFCEVRFDIKRGVEGKMLIPGMALVSLASEVDDGDLSFKFGKDKDTVEVQASRAEISLPTIQVDFFPSPSENPNKAQLARYNTTRLSEALKFMKVFVGTDKSRSDTMIAELRNKRFMATDATKVGVYESDSFPDEGFILQSRGISGALNFLKMESSQEILIGKTEHFTWWKGMKATLAFRADERSFPKDTEKDILEMKSLSHARIAQGTVERVIRRLRISLDDPNSKMTMGLAGVDDADLTITTVNSKGRTSEEAVPVKRLEGSEDVKMDLGCKDLLDVVQANLFKDAEIDFLHDPVTKTLKIAYDSDAFKAFGIILTKS